MKGIDFCKSASRPPHPALCGRLHTPRPTPAIVMPTMHRTTHPATDSFRQARRPSFSRLTGLVVSLVLVTLGTAGCSWSTLGSGSGNARIRSVVNGDSLAAQLPTRVYTSRDRSTADFYMTDLPLEVFTQGRDVSDAAGIVIHVRQFILPKAGRTPIAATASTASVRVLVLAKGDIGVYGGGGFLQNGDAPGERTMSASISEASLRLIRRTAGFEDRLVNATFSGSFSATKDEPASDAIARGMDVLTRYTLSVQEIDDQGLN